MQNINEQIADAAPLPMLLTASIIRKQIVPISKRQFHRWIAAGTFPAADVQTHGKFFWTRERVLAWLEENSTAATAANR